MTRTTQPLALLLAALLTLGLWSATLAAPGSDAASARIVRLA